MLIIGAKGFAKEVLEVLFQLNDIDNLVFYDDLNINAPKKIFDKFPVLKSRQEVVTYFKEYDNRFTIGIGNPRLRRKMYDQFNSLGGVLTSTISPYSNIGNFDVQIKIGTNILSGSNISNGTLIGKACIIYYNSVITHDCVVDDFVEISPNVNLLGRCKIGSYTHIGASATVLPDIKIGNNVIIGAGAVVTNNIPDNCIAVGVPAKVIKQN